MKINDMPRAQWSPLPMEGCVGVQGRVLLATPALLVAMLKLEPNGTIHEHAADWDIHAICLEGEGCVSVGDEIAEIHAGQWVQWPTWKQHRLWTQESAMVALMLEHLNSR